MMCKRPLWTRASAGGADLSLFANGTSNSTFSAGEQRAGSAAPTQYVVGLPAVLPIALGRCNTILA
jgi:hypothetical protein